MVTKTEDKAKDAKKVEAGEPAPKSKLGLVIGAVTFLVLGAGAAVMAVPKKAEPIPRLEGPFVARLSKEDLQVNLAGENGKRYLVLGLSAEYFAYDQAAVLKQLGVEAETSDPLFATRLTDTMLRLAARKTREQVEDAVQMEAFLMEVRAAVEPLLFPVCVGDSTSPQTRDMKSGLRAGESIMDSSLRGLLHEHVLAVDSTRKTVRLDEGPEVAYTGEERDLRVTSPTGLYTFVDVTGLLPEFSGDVPIGVLGRLRRIYRGQVLVQ
jgi:flagellar basal body-associated protein FliL